MDATSPEMIDFVIVPIETMVACICILWQVDQAIKHSMQEIHEAAAGWLRRSPLFEDTRNELAQYLELPAGFSASTLRIMNNGAIFNRSAVLLQQSTREYYLTITNQYGFLSNAESNKQKYRAFLTQLMWMREDPIARMFKSDFKGEFQDHSKVTDIGGLSYQLESFSVAALTERADNDTAESDAIKLPTLKYIAIIETDNDNKAIFDLEFADVNQDKHKVLVIAKDMCTEMVSKGYESKVKLQDIMEMAVKMAKK
ncbi:hypothetical protein J4E90_008767 [Alternaria incomplexa]|uniref:uncharacterized protein n=1 Tax=Alternaria incomplexa TaxID=1187928 RepID=UPI00221FBB58|nr:uncharacterized protein J4E90_008767 [Alternaria incomplexa]KAI4908143.1 hypothetical protein J4E90_008767 [Alternaria incomplexa]